MCPNCGERPDEPYATLGWKEAMEEAGKRLEKERAEEAKKEEMTPEEAKTVGCLFLLLLVGLGIFFLYRQFIA
ncbi:MAG: hypothetical protein AAB534_03345 [Patescibacteria group bacterium]